MIELNHLMSTRSPSSKPQSGLKSPAEANGDYSQMNTSGLPKSSNFVDARKHKKGRTMSSHFSIYQTKDMAGVGFKSPTRGRV
jgi:hypothetical protein